MASDRLATWVFVVPRDVARPTWLLGFQPPRLAEFRSQGLAGPLVRGMTSLANDIGEGRTSAWDTIFAIPGAPIAESG